jgi:seryl-tRNA synthetase
LGVVVTLTAVGEHLSRRMIERRFHSALEARQQFERQVSGILSTHQQLTNEVATQRQRNRELSDAIAAKGAELEQAVGRLSEESRTIRELEQRLRTQEQQMAQLQGELSSALQRAQVSADAAPEAAVELERVMVSGAGTPSFQGRVISVHPEWNFVVVDLGWDAVKIGDTISILRNEAVLAKAKVERVQEDVSAVAVMPEWNAADIQVNDRAQLL